MFGDLENRFQGPGLWGGVQVQVGAGSSGFGAGLPTHVPFVCRAVHL